MAKYRFIESSKLNFINENGIDHTFGAGMTVGFSTRAYLNYKKYKTLKDTYNSLVIKKEKLEGILASLKSKSVKTKESFIKSPFEITGLIAGTGMIYTAQMVTGMEYKVGIIKKEIEDLKAKIRKINPKYDFNDLDTAEFKESYVPATVPAQLQNMQNNKDANAICNQLKIDINKILNSSDSPSSIEFKFKFFGPSFPQSKAYHINQIIQFWTDGTPVTYGWNRPDVLANETYLVFTGNGDCKILSGCFYVNGKNSDKYGAYKKYFETTYKHVYSKFKYEIETLANKHNYNNLDKMLLASGFFALSDFGSNYNIRNIGVAAIETSSMTNPSHCFDIKLRK